MPWVKAKCLIMVILSLHIRSHFVEILIVVGKDMVPQVGIILANLATFWTLGPLFIIVGRRLTLNSL